MIPASFPTQGISPGVGGNVETLSEECRTYGVTKEKKVKNWARS